MAGYGYILANRKFGTLYAGVTSDIAARMKIALIERANPGWRDLVFDIPA